MKKINLSIDDYIGVSYTNKYDALWKNCPFNLNFRKLNLNKSKKITGPCIYFISANGIVLYIGKYQPKNGNVIGDRWIKHLTTISIRGSGIGFGSEFKYKKLSKVVENKDLKRILTKAITNNRREIFFRDSGKTTSINRIRYASHNWKDINKLTKDDFLNFFTIHAYIYESDFKQDQINKTISNIERSILEKMQPPCNKEFNITKSPINHNFCIRSVEEEILGCIRHHSIAASWKYYVLKKIASS